MCRLGSILYLVGYLADTCGDLFLGSFWESDVDIVVGISWNDDYILFTRSDVRVGASDGLFTCYRFLYGYGIRLTSEYDISVRK